MRALTRLATSPKLAALALSLLLAGCGGGSGGEAPAHNVTPSVAPSVAQAVLGPLAGAEINAYRLTDLNNPIGGLIEGPIQANASRDLQAAGRFTLTLPELPDAAWVLVTATGGSDLDPTPNQGTVHALARAADWRAGQAHVSALPEISWLFAKDLLTDEAALASRLDRLAGSLLSQDLNGDGQLDSRDLAFFHPTDHLQQTRIDYRALLPDADSTHHTLVEQLHAGAVEFDSTARTAWLETQWGDTPWNRAPSINAGVDQAVNEQSVVTLSGTGSDSDGSIVGYI
ncbi:MAG: hypothetical protein V7629_09380 [Motiliproteus sp.]